MQGFLKNLYLRPSCYECPTKCGKSHSDITLADFWGIRNLHPELHSDKGVSLILSNSEYGKDILQSLNLEYHEVSYSEATESNPSIMHSAIKPQQYSLFWIEYEKHGLKAIKSIIRKMKPSFLFRIKRKVKFLISRIFKVYTSRLRRSLL